MEILSKGLLFWMRSIYTVERQSLNNALLNVERRSNQLNLQSVTM